MGRALANPIMFTLDAIDGFRCTLPILWTAATLTCPTKHWQSAAVAEMGRDRHVNASAVTTSSSSELAYDV
jgi:hypothetical protein